MYLFSLRTFGLNCIMKKLMEATRSKKTSWKLCTDLGGRRLASLKRQGEQNFAGTSWFSSTDFGAKLKKKPGNSTIFLFQFACLALPLCASVFAFLFQKRSFQKAFLILKMTLSNICTLLCVLWVALDIPTFYVMKAFPQLKSAIVVCSASLNRTDCQSPSLNTPARTP